MVTKTQVYDFVEKVKYKALESVNEKFVVELQETIDAELNKPENHVLKEAVDSIIYHSAAGLSAQNTIRKYVPQCCNYLSDAKDVKNGMFRSGWNFPEGFDAIRTVHAENNEKVRRIREEYDKIMKIVKRKKNGDQGKTALIALGFDCSYLDKLSTLPVVIKEAEIKVDKSLLFPCGETGIDA